MDTFTATYSPDDNKLRLTSLTRLSAELYARVKAAGFKWAPKLEQFIAPMWTPEREDLLIELAGEIEDEDSTLAERAEERAERFDGYAVKREKEGNSAADYAHRIGGGIPLGQPILVGHHSQRRAERDAQKIENAMRRAVSAFETADYWQRRAAGAIAHARYKELPAVRYRRIKGIEADQRKTQKEIDGMERVIAIFTRPDLTLKQAQHAANFAYSDFGFFLSNLYSAIEKEPEKYAEHCAKCADGLRRQIPRRQRWIDHYTNRIAYERAMLGEGETSKLVGERLELKVGGTVQITRDRGATYTILRVNKKEGAIVSVRLNRRYVPIVGVEDITDYTPPSEEEAAKTAAAMKRPPLCNYHGAEFATCTKEQWKKISADYKTQAHRIKATDTTEAHCVRYALGVYLNLPPKPDSVTCSTNWTHVYWPVFITDEKFKEPPKKAITMIDPTVAPISEPSQPQQHAAPASFSEVFV